MKSPQVPLQQRVLQYVLNNGPCTIKQVVAKCGRYISESSALSYGRKADQYHRRYEEKLGRKSPARAKSSAEIARAGRSRLVGCLLSQLANRYRKIIRTGKATYGPPPPKVHEPSIAV